MTSINPHDGTDPTSSQPIDEGGLRAPPGLSGWRKAWWWFDFIILVKLARLRFIAVLIAIGAVITQWEHLVAIHEKWTRPANQTYGVSSDVEYFCPMHPAVVRDNPKEKCPVCYMPLSKRKKGDAHDEVLPAGVVNRVQLSPYRVVLAGIETWCVDYQPLVKEITSIGYVEFNERNLKHVAARVKGRIDILYVNETGRMVAAGDELASLYSPELLVSLQTLLEAQRSGRPGMLESTRLRLQLLGISDDQIDEVLKTGKATTHLKIRSPIAGHVIKKYVREGQYVDEGSPLYDVADLSTVWIQAQVYEDEMAFLGKEMIHEEDPGNFEGLPVTATTRALPGESFQGRLSFIYPHVDQETRTVTVRFELANPGHKLRPGTTATVRLKIPPQKLALFSKSANSDQVPEHAERTRQGLVLAVPESAIIDTGSQTIVYRELTPGTYEGVKVQLGPRMTSADDVTFFPVLSGLAEGDRIAVAGTFLVDAETRLNPAAGSIYFGGSGGSKSGASGVTVRPSTPEDEDAKLKAVLAKLPVADQKLIAAQRFCPVLKDSRLGSMGPPVKLMIEGQPVFLCCDNCKKSATADPKATLAKVDKLKNSLPRNETPAAVIEPPPAGKTNSKITAALSKLSEADRRLAQAQQFCAVLEDSPLGSMGTPIKVMVDGKPVFLCCKGCQEEALADPKATSKKVEQLIKAAKVRGAVKQP